MKIKVGEYVRTKSGDIGIFNKYFEDKAWFEMKKNDDDFYGIQVSAIVKHSFNIIDLIEENDIVGYRINCLSEFKVGRVKKYKDARNDKQYLGVESYDITKIYIDEILTHEQYERNCYRIN